MIKLQLKLTPLKMRKIRKIPNTTTVSIFISSNICSNFETIFGLGKGEKSSNSRKLRAVQVMQESIIDYTRSHKDVSLKDFSEASVAIVREARQLPDANNLKKTYGFKLSPYGPNPNGMHTVMAKIESV